jgi:CheY-like chemotaxis protein
MSAEAHTQPDILIIEDDADLRDTLAEVLALEGYKVHRAANGLQALQLLRLHPPPAVILMDLMMPVMDGWVFRSLLKQDPVLGQIPVVVMSAVAPSGLREASLDAVGFLPKPVDMDDLFTLVARCCRSER